MSWNLTISVWNDCNLWASTEKFQRFTILREEMYPRLCPKPILRLCLLLTDSLVKGNILPPSNCQALWCFVNSSETCSHSCLWLALVKHTRTECCRVPIQTVFPIGNPSVYPSNSICYNVQSSFSTVLLHIGLSKGDSFNRTNVCKLLDWL